MSSIQSPALVPSSSAPRAIPTLAELEEMVREPDQRVVSRGVDYAFYERLVDSIPEWRHIHVDFDGKDLEVMSPGIQHDGDRKLLGQFVEAIAQVLRIPYKSAGQTTWKRPEIARGLEADESYYFQADKLEAVAASKARRASGIADYPNADLAIEVDISPSKVDRAGIYAALEVPEVWRFDGDQLVIEQLGDDGQYHPSETSRFLPVTPAQVRHWVVDEDSSDESAWARRLRAWAELLSPPSI